MERGGPVLTSGFLSCHTDARCSHKMNLLTSQDHAAVKVLRAETRAQFSFSFSSKENSPNHTQQDFSSEYSLFNYLIR